MLISSSALVENIGWVLEHEIAPAVQDQPWLASYLRSIAGLLPYLGALVEFEAPALVADNADLRQTLAAVAAAGVTAEDIGEVLRRFEGESAAFSLAELRAENRAYRMQLNRALPLLHEDAGHVAV